MKRTIIYLTLILLSLVVGIGVSAQTAAGHATEQIEQQATIKAVSGAVEVDNPTEKTIEVSVFAITGQLVRQETLEGGVRARIELPSGYYIVKADTTLKRIAIQ